MGHILSGQLQLESEAESFQVRQGDSFFHMPICDLIIKSCSPCELQVAVGVGSQLFSQLDQVFDTHLAIIPTQENPRVSEYFNWMYDIAKTGGAHREQRTACLLEALILELHAVSTARAEHKGAAFANWVRCKDYIDTHYMKTHSVRDWASACHIDRSHLSRLARRFTKGTAHNYLQHLRLAFSAELLINTTYSIHQIAEEGGWSDPFVFSKAFRREFGYPPNTYRRKPSTVNRIT